MLCDLVFIGLLLTLCYFAIGGGEMQGECGDSWGFVAGSSGAKEGRSVVPPVASLRAALRPPAERKRTSRGSYGTAEAVPFWIWAQDESRWRNPTSQKRDVGHPA